MANDKNETTGTLPVTGSGIHHFSSMSTIVLIVFLIVVTGVIGYAAGLQTQTDESIPIEDKSSQQDVDLTYAGPDPISYTDDKFGFSFELPAGYGILRHTTGEGAPATSLDFGKLSKTGVLTKSGVDIVYIRDQKTLQTLKEEMKAENPISEKSITVDGHNAVLYEIGGFGSGQTIVVADDVGYVYIREYDGDRDLFEAVYSSFEF